MKHIFEKIKLTSIALLLIVSNYSFSFVEIVSSSTRIVAVRDVIDLSGNLVIQVAIGASGSNPNTWIISNISNSVSITNNYNPKIFLNTNGDIVVLWGYIDSMSGIPELAGGYLLNSSSVWQVTNISENMGSVDSGNYTATFDSATSAVIAWSSTMSNQIESFAARVDLNTNTWTTPYMLPI